MVGYDRETFSRWLDKMYKTRAGGSLFFVRCNGIGYEGFFEYSRNNLINYIQELIRQFEMNREETIKRIGENKFWDIPIIKITNSNLNFKKYSGNSMYTTDVPKILYKLVLEKYISKDIVEKFVKKNKDYYEVISIEEILFVIRLIGEK